jgi:hypothetical protein
VACEGELVGARYRLLRTIGQGAMGVVWRAWDERLERVVAVKHLVHQAPADHTTAFRTIERALREARVTARLKHPHAITVHDIVEGTGSPCLVMEYFESRPLTELLEEHGPIPAVRVAEIGRQVASALAVAHAGRILHRDVTPNNVLIAADGTAKIADFGLSHAMGEGTMTGGGLVVGTPAYLSPEVADGQEAGFPSDVFSLGATLYTAVEGAPPFGVGENPLALLKRVANDEVATPRKAGPLGDVLRQLLRRDPLDRPTMADAERLLAAVTEIRSPPDEPGPAAEAPRRRSPRRRLAARGAAAACLVASGVLVGVSVSAGPAVNRSSAAQEPAAPEPAARPATTTPAAGTGRPECAARYQLTKTWPGGYQVLVTVRNDGAAPVHGWTVGWRLPAGDHVDDLWNGTLVQHGPAVTVTSLGWNATLAPGESTTFGLITLARREPAGVPITACETTG